MGWTSTVASHYKWSGSKYVIDRKAECDDLFNQPMVTRDGDNYKTIGEFKVLRSSMVGSTYYAAVKSTKFATDTEPEDSMVFAAICLTSTNMKDYHNFSYKDMDETCGPYKYDCPKGILDLLTPTDSEWANNWRQACRERLASKPKRSALSKLPIGTVIEVIAPRDFSRYKKGDVMTLTKKQVHRTKTAFCDDRYYYHATQLGNDYKVIRQAVGNV